MPYKNFPYRLLKHEKKMNENFLNYKKSFVVKHHKIPKQLIENTKSLQELTLVCIDYVLEQKRFPKRIDGIKKYLEVIFTINYKDQPHFI